MMWYSVAELLELPGLPQTTQAIARKAKRENWKSRERDGQGGGREYFIDSLPQETQTYLRQQRLESLKQRAIEEGVVPRQPPSVAQLSREYWKAEFEGLEETAPRGFNKLLDPRFRGHLEIQKEYERYLTEEINQFPNKVTLQVIFCDRYNARQLDISEDTYTLIPHISRTTLLKKRQQMCEEGSITPLFDKRGENRRGCGLIESFPGLAAAVEEILAMGHFAPRKICKLLKDWYEFVLLPTEGQVRYWVQNFAKKNPARMAVYKSIDLSPAFGFRDDGLERPNQEWQLDSSPTDVMLKYQDERGRWKKKRYAVVACLDVYTRRAKVLITERSRSEAILLLLKNTILDWGMPESIRTDNGKDYRAKQVEGFLDLLEIDLKRCKPYSPKEKPFVERFFRTFQEATELLPGFVGHSLKDRERLRKRPDWDEKTVDLEMDLPTFADWAARWCKEYETQPHQGLGGMRPLEVLTEAMGEGWQPKAIASQNQRQVLDLLSQQGAERMVQRQGIQVNGQYYVARELGNLTGMGVHVRFDKDDPYRIFVYTNDKLEQFICEAQWRDAVSPERLNRLSVGATKLYQAKERACSEIQRQSRRKRKAIAQNSTQALRDNVEAMPRTATVYETVAIKTVTEINEVPVPQPVSPEERERASKVLEIQEKARQRELEQEMARQAKKKAEELDLYSELYYKEIFGGGVTEEEKATMKRLELGMTLAGLAAKRRIVEIGMYTPSFVAAG